MNQIKIACFCSTLLFFVAVNSQPLKPLEVNNLSVNSEYAELGVKFYKNGKVIFASSKINKTENKRDRRNNRQMGLRLYSGEISNDGTINNVTLFSTEEFNPILEANLAFTSDFKTVYFTRNGYIQDDYRKYFKKEAKKTHFLKIYKANINESGVLSNVTPLPINSDSHSVTNPVLNKSGNKLYFASNMEGSYGEFDLYAISINSDGSYGKPVNLGSKVNTSRNELFPFISEDDFLYFSSDGHGGIGALDVFRIPIYELFTNTSKNLGAPINSEADDFSLIYSNSKNIGYLTSTRKESVGDADIYTFKYTINEEPILEEKEVEEIVSAEDITANTIVEIEDFKTIDEESNVAILTKEAQLDTIKVDTVSIAKKQDTAVTKINSDSITPTVIVATAVKVEDDNECVQTVEGTILNENNSIMADAKITLYENGQNIGTYDLKPDGKYSFQLKCNNHYRVTARLNNFEESYFELKTTRFTGGKTTQNIIMPKIPCDVILLGTLKDINSKTVLGGVKVYLVENNKQINATETNELGNYTFTAPCDGNYKIATEKLGYEEILVSVSKSPIHNEKFFLGNELTPIACEQIVRGRINNELDGLPIVNATVNLYDESSNIITTVNSNSNGNFHINIKCETDYRLEVSMTDFETGITEFTSTDVQKENHRIDFNLKSTICAQTITGMVTNSRTKIPMSNVSVDLLENDQVISNLTTASDGTFSFEVDCSSNYKISATTKDYSIDSKIINTDNVHGANTTVSIILETKLDFEMVRDNLMIITDQIDFDLNESDIREDAAIELNKVVAIMNRNPEIKVDIGVHTDSRAPDNYNLTLSEQRAQSILSFLIERGINSDRLTGKGYGETELLNRCANGVNCSETEHLENRRIEFIVTR
ncbi:carboxypeptidase regulatory-like domain-containing protein [Urechidicola vernalis]|uniref:Carboxypeptidase regulatory-like domain-containing protein n=1 Tax=Urechidicola vernalis TaxID=3075600 RepID=A0ABU2Y0Y4_9FLAO|nr:carboxypeptidase regulatory-like domain-containing protein [Urechidicola sp. P050]MDT0551776.1 carboxypeptidase regulatory-like domain-containing protein [Urechidicola sp. P050]